VAIGTLAGNNSQGTGAIAMGYQAGQNTQGPSAIAIGNSAGSTGQRLQAIAIGFGAGVNTQSTNSIAIGVNCGRNIQGQQSIAIGENAGNDTQGASSIAFGKNAGQSTQGPSAIAIGNTAGQTGQQSGAIAMGFQAGAFGATAGSTQGQGVNAIAIGNSAGSTFQGSGAIAIGTSAGISTQGVNAIAIGVLAGSQQAANSIVINALGTVVTGATASATYIAPVRNITQTTVLGYNTTTNEVTYYATPSGGVTIASTNLLYDDFMSCPLNNPTTPIGLMGIQASTTSAFLSPYTGTKIPGYSGVIQLLNPLGVTNTCWDIYNSQPFAFDNLAIGAAAGSVVPIGMTHKFFADLVYTPNVVQYIGVFSTLSSSIATMTSTLPNVFITVQFTAGLNGTLTYYVNGVASGGSPVLVALSTISAWYNFGIRRTASNTFAITGLFGTSGTYTNITAPMYLRCGSYTTSAIAQSARIYVDYAGVQLNTR
jgi:hypothetical protein